MNGKLSKFRNDAAWSIITFALNRVATKQFKTKFLKGVNLSPKGESETTRAWSELYPPGSTLRTDCAYCKKFYTQEITAGRPFPSIYCTKTHRVKHSAEMRKYRDNPENCPHPHKASYQTFDSAEKHRVTIARATPEMSTNRVYACKCGRYHLGRWHYEIVGKEN